MMLFSSEAPNLPGYEKNELFQIFYSELYDE